MNKTDLQKIAGANTVQKKPESRLPVFLSIVATVVSAAVRLIAHIFIKKGNGSLGINGGCVEIETEQRLPDGTVNTCRVKIKGPSASANGSLEI